MVVARTRTADEEAIMDTRVNSSKFSRVTLKVRVGVLRTTPLVGVVE